MQDNGSCPCAWQVAPRIWPCGAPGRPREKIRKSKIGDFFADFWFCPLCNSCTPTRCCPARTPTHLRLPRLAFPNSSDTPYGPSDRTFNLGTIVVDIMKQSLSTLWNNCCPTCCCIGGFDRFWPPNSRPFSFSSDSRWWKRGFFKHSFSSSRLQIPFVTPQESVTNSFSFHDYKSHLYFCNSRFRVWAALQIQWRIWDWGSEDLDDDYESGLWIWIMDYGSGWGIWRSGSRIFDDRYQILEIESKIDEKLTLGPPGTQVGNLGALWEGPGGPAVPAGPQNDTKINRKVMLNVSDPARKNSR